MLSVSQYHGVIEKEYDSNVLIRSKEESRRYFIVKPNDLVVNVMWLHYRGLGVSSIEGIVSPDYHVYKIDSKIVDPQFLNYLVRSNLYLNEYPRYLRGIRPNSSRIREYSFMRLPLLLPPLFEQNKISEYLRNAESNIDSLIGKFQRQNQQLQEYRQVLTTTLVTGKIDVRQRMTIP
jgi:type I restriction enzyme S subunit